MPLAWSDQREPGETSCYKHVVAETPLGDLIIEWKGWKDNDSPGCQMPWGEYVSGRDLVEAKANIQSAWDAMSAKVAALAERRVQT